MYNVAPSHDYLFNMDLGSLIDLTLGGAMSHGLLWFEMSSVLLVRVRCHYYDVKRVLDNSVLMFCLFSYKLGLRLLLNVLQVVQMNVLHMDEYHFMIESKNYPFQHLKSLSHHHNKIIDLEANHKRGREKVNNVIQSSASTGISTITMSAQITQKWQFCYSSFVAMKEKPKSGLTFKIMHTISVASLIADVMTNNGWVTSDASNLHVVTGHDISLGVCLPQFNHNLDELHSLPGCRISPQGHWCMPRSSTVHAVGAMPQSRRRPPQSMR